ncbi:MAG TPA: transposase [Gemmatimonadales bacterium]|nr:transposase [Gemmatimonadales bacterium]
MLDASHVQQLVADLLTPILGTWTHARCCTCQAVVAVLTYAAARLVSLHDACGRLANAPDSDTVFDRLHRQLTSADQLDHRVRRALAEQLPRALRRGRWRIAIDTTLIPYHGRPFADPDEIYRGQPKSGTTHFHAYATAFVIHAGRRFTLAVLGVQKGTPAEQVVATLRQRVLAAGVTPRLFLLDRGFNTAGVVRYLHATRQPFIMPQAVHGKAPKDGTLRGLRAIRAEHPTGWTTYTWKPTGQRRVTVALCVLRRRRRDRHGHRTFLYACWGVRWTPRSVYRVYRLRFGVETSYRQMNQVRIRTSTRSPILRLLFVAIALLLRNLWVRLHWLWLASQCRGGRRLRLHRLRLRTLTLWLAHLAEEWFGYRDQIETEHPPLEELASRLPKTR